MAIVTEYKCTDCGLELADDGRVFIWDAESGTTEDFLILMNTCQLLHGAKIRGSVYETYCSECGKFLKVYSIEEVMDGVENPCELVREGIDKHISQYGAELQRLKDIEKRSDYTIEKEDNHYIVRVPEYDFYYSNYFFQYMSRQEVIEDALNDFHEEIGQEIEGKSRIHERYLNSIYLIVDDTGRLHDDYDVLEKVNCPECGKEIHKHVHHDIPCPRCGGKFFTMGEVCYD